MPTYDPKTLSYSEDAKGWPSFYSFLPDYMIGMNGYFYTWSGGDLYRHNTNAVRNEYYGTLYSSTITSVFNFEPMTIKLFKTMSYESNDRWECSDLFTDLSTGNMLETFFEQKEGEWFTFLRDNQGTVNFRSRSSNGIGTILSIGGPLNAVVTEFNLDTLGSIVSVGDGAYEVIPQPPNTPSGSPTFLGLITAIVRERTEDAAGVVTNPSITIDCTTSGIFPTVARFCVGLKNAVAESHGARGYFMNFTLANDNTSAVELFSVGSSVMKSFP